MNIHEMNEINEINHSVHFHVINRLRSFWMLFMRSTSLSTPVLRQSHDYRIRCLQPPEFQHARKPSGQTEVGYKMLQVKHGWKQESMGQVKNLLNVHVSTPKKCTADAWILPLVS